MSNSKGTALHAGVRQRWSIVTGQDETVREEAEKLVAEAAREAGARHPDNSAAADAWMDLLRREGTYYKNGWVIKQLRVASAKYCSTLASEARNHGNEPKTLAFDSLQNRFLALPDPRGILHAVHKRNPEDADCREDRPSALGRVEKVQSIARPPLATSLAVAAPGGESVTVAVQPPTLVESEKVTEPKSSNAPAESASALAAKVEPATGGTAPTKKEVTTAARKQAKRAKVRCMWLDQKRSEHPDWTSDEYIHDAGGPTYNTIRRYRRGKESTHDPYVRGAFAKAFGCALSEVPD